MSHPKNEGPPVVYFRKISRSALTAPIFDHVKLISFDGTRDENHLKGVQTWEFSSGRRIEIDFDLKKG